MNIELARRLLASSILATVVAAAPAHALSIRMNDVNNLAQSNAQAYQGFVVAQRFWESMLTNDVEVAFNIGFSSAGFAATTIGSTGTTRFLGTGTNVAAITQQIAATGNSQLDQIALGQLQTITQTGVLSAITQQAKPNGQGVLQNVRQAPTNNLNAIELVSNREWDSDGSLNNDQLWTNSAVLKAIGYTLQDTSYLAVNRDAMGRGIDAKITFNSAFAFDFDPTNGISAGTIDFIGTAIHEFGHGLGFVSGVDIYDANTNIAANLDTLQGLMSVLDLFRYSDDVNNLAPGSAPALDWSVGNSAIVGDNLRGRSYFSFDGLTKGLSSFGGNAGYFSTGATNGDGRQASHWMDTPYVALPGNSPTTQCGAPVTPSRGIMDPTAVGCEEGMFTALDLAAFDAMGWNTRIDVLSNTGLVFSSSDAFNGTLSVPEPATWAMLIMGFGGVGSAIRSRRRRLAPVRVGS